MGKAGSGRLYCLKRIDATRTITTNAYTQIRGADLMIFRHRMGQTNNRQYAFKVDFEERLAFNQAVAANGGSAVTEIRRMVDGFLHDQSLYGWIMNASKHRKSPEFPVKEVRINAHFDDTTLRRFTVTCQYANVQVAHLLREMIIAYAQGLLHTTSAQAEID